MAGRASNGESTIYKGADGRWHGYVSVGFKLDGKLDRRHLSSKSRGVVVAKVRELERQRDTGTVGETSTPSVAWWLEHWLTAIAPRRVRRGTLESYESAVRKHLIPGIGRHRLERLRPEHLDELYTALLDDGYSPASVLRHHRIQSRALTVAASTVDAASRSRRIRTGSLIPIPGMRPDLCRTGTVVRPVLNTVRRTIRKKAESGRTAAGPGDRSGPMAKRGNGEGSIFKRANGRWYSALTYRNDFGEVRRREVSGRTQAEVRAKLRELRERLEAGAPVRDASIMMAVWLEDWTTKALPASDRKQATIDLYATIARSHLVPKLGSLPLDRLRPSDVEALVLEKRRAGLSASTVRTIYTVLRAALDVAVRDGLIQRNPAALIKRPAVERKDAGYLSAQQAEALLEAIRGDRLEALYRVMLATGLRRGEALALHWRDVDLDAAVLRVRWTLSRTSAGLELGEPKTEKSRRTVPLPVPAVEALRAHRKRQAAEQLAAGSLWQSNGLVFTSEIGTPLEPRNVLRRFEALAERAGLRGVHLHTLRHSAASFLLAAGTHTKVVQEHLGHSSYTITADIYSHVAPAQQREAADKLGQAIHW